MYHERKKHLIDFSSQKYRRIRVNKDIFCIFLIVFPESVRIQLQPNNSNGQNLYRQSLCLCSINKLKAIHIEETFGERAFSIL